jgi:uncharacterized protein YuzE
MRLIYDPRHNVVYISVREPLGPVETVCVNGELNVALAP